MNSNKAGKGASIQGSLLVLPAAAPPVLEDIRRYPNDGYVQSEQKNGSQEKVTLIFFQPSMPREDPCAAYEKQNDRHGEIVTHAA
jgi:hypothetical protein